MVRSLKDLFDTLYAIPLIHRASSWKRKKAFRKCLQANVTWLLRLGEGAVACGYFRDIWPVSACEASVDTKPLHFPYSKKYVLRKDHVLLAVLFYQSNYNWRK